MADDDLLTERLLRVIDEGRRTATYKLALLMALIDAAALSPGKRRIPTRSIAELVLETYYPQTRVYVANDGIERELRQITMKGSPPGGDVPVVRYRVRTAALRTTLIPAGTRQGSAVR